jgi:hypothetical protein
LGSTSFSGSGSSLTFGTGTLSLAGNVTHSGAFTQTFTATANTSVTLPTSGTLQTTTGSLASNTGLPISTGLSGLTTNGVAYATSSTALATGSGLVFNGTQLGIGTTSLSALLNLSGVAATGIQSLLSNGTTTAYNYFTLSNTSGNMRIGIEGSSGGVIMTGSSAYSSTISSVGNTNLHLGTNANANLTIDTSGNLGLGVTPSAWYSAYKAIELPSAGFLAFAAPYGQITANAYYDGSYKYKTSATATQYAQSAGQHQWFNAPSGTAGNAITFTQAMTLDASGNLLLNSTSNFATSSRQFIKFDEQAQVGITLQTTNTITGGSYLYFVNSSGSLAGSISHSGSTAVLYNATSDQRLKTDLGQVTSTNVIDNTIVHDFVWKTDGTQARGVFAQEAYKVIPQAVKVGDDDEEVKETWGVDYSKYVPDLIVYCQQLKEEIQSLKAEVAKLKGA